MAKNLFIDVETYSSVNLKDCGAYKYIESPDFEILIIGYALDNGPVKSVDLAQGEEMPEEFEEALLASIPQKTIEMNKKAFELGYSAV